LVSADFFSGDVSERPFISYFTFSLLWRDPPNATSSHAPPYTAASACSSSSAAAGELWRQSMKALEHFK
jgi:hypothetical protein